MLKYPQSMLGAMFSGRYKAMTDPQGRHFIDRDGLLFRHVLNYLRTESLSTLDVTNVSALNEVHQEAVYYQIEPLIQLLNVFLAKVDAAETSTLQRYRSRVREESMKGSATSSVASASYPTLSSAATQRVLRTQPSTTSRTRRATPMEPPVYSREEIHMFKLKHATSYGAKAKLNLAGLDLRGLDLSRLDLSGIDFSRCNLEGALFECATLINCSFSEANLRLANFQQASFGNSDTECPDFTDANLDGANFSRYVGILYRNRFEGVEDGMVGLEIRWLR
jgi:hypothetical protein